jgi:hypothetical protein
MITSIDQTAVNLGIATLLGAGIGFERQWRQRMAGLRTNTLVGGPSRFHYFGLKGAAKAEVTATVCATSKWYFDQKRSENHPAFRRHAADTGTRSRWRTFSKGLTDI